MFRLIAMLPFIAVALLNGCSSESQSKVTSGGPQSETSSRPRLSASEEFRLRGECAKLADKLEALEGYSDPTVTENWSSNYKADDNRCYVEQSSYNKSMKHSTVNLFDGQTREVLAYTLDDHDGTKGLVGNRSDIVFTPDCISPGSDCGYAAISAYIEKCMQRDSE